MCRSVSLCAEALSKLQAGKMQKPAERHIGHFQLFTIRAVTATPLHMKKPPRESEAVSLCWHYLSFRQVTLQVLSARTSLTSVFGMGTGGPSSQSIPTILFPYTLKTEHCAFAISLKAFTEPALWSSFRLISISQLHTLPCFHL